MTLIEVGGKYLARPASCSARRHTCSRSIRQSPGGVAALDRQLDPARHTRQRVLEPRRGTVHGQLAVDQPRMNIRLSQRITLASGEDRGVQRHDLESCRPTPTSA